jgi:hypothetical protein
MVDHPTRECTIQKFREHIFQGVWKEHMDIISMGQG